MSVKFRDEHPMVTFRDGPTGRRADLVSDGVVTRSQIDAVLAYRAAYADEIQARIELHRSETTAAEAR